MQTVSIASAARYTWGDGCDGWHLLRGEDLSVIEERMPPGTCEQRHLHRHARQFFYLLQGEAVLELDGVRHVLTPGLGLHVPPGVAHQMRNDSPADARFLVVSSPRSHGDRIAAPMIGIEGASA